MAATDGYNASFYEGQRDGSSRSAAAVVPLVVETVGPATAVDVGCGVGTWTRALLDAGVDAVGVDGDYVDRGALAIARERFLARDLRLPLDLGRTFDLAMSLEVGEHLPPASAAPFVRELTALAPVVLFSAAIPWQGGVRHLNERWQSYWVGLFGECGYEPYDVVRPRVWADPAIDPWYAQNTLLFATADAAARVGLGDAERPALLDVIHPELYRRQHVPQPARELWARRLRHAAGRVALYRGRAG
jgi:SAM-dependent methyltransferase